MHLVGEYFEKYGNLHETKLFLDKLVTFVDTVMFLHEKKLPIVI